MNKSQLLLFPFALSFALSIAPQPADANTPPRMMAECRAKAARALSTRMPNVETKYEGQRTDGTHAVNGTATTAKGVRTFQCSFGKRGRRIIRFVVNRPQGQATQLPSGNKLAEMRCLAAVASQTKPGVSTISVRRGENATIVMVRVPGAQKPWRCDFDGSKVTRVMYMGAG